MAYEPLDTLKKEIRLLAILPSGPSDLIHCKLYNIPLDDAVGFVAISYVWGDHLDTEKIVVNGEVREVTVSCWEILNIHSMMLAHRPPKPIWIDAICINQNDLREREQQVLRMHLIYAKGYCEIHLGHCPRDPFAPWDDLVAVKALRILAKRWQLKYYGATPRQHQSNSKVLHMAVKVLGILEERWHSRLYLDKSEARDHNFGKGVLRHAVKVFTILEKLWVAEDLPDDIPDGHQVRKYDLVREAFRSMIKSFTIRAKRWHLRSYRGGYKAREHNSGRIFFHAVVNVLTILAKRWHSRGYLGLHRVRENNSRKTFNRKEEYVEESLGHICGFLDKPWFSRMWIVQEFVIGSTKENSRLIGDRCSIGMFELYHACSELSSWTINLPPVQRRALSVGIQRYLHLMYATKKYHVCHLERIMVPLLSTFQGQRASDSRDKVYSILGLLQPINEGGSTEVAGRPIHPQEFDRQSLPIDYTAPVEEVYARAVKSVVIATGRLDIICLCQEQGEFNRTWTPDLRQPWSLTSINRTIYFRTPSEIYFQASGSMDAEAIFSDDLLVLYARGIHHSTIVRASIKWSSRSIHDIISLEKELSSLLGPEHTHLEGDGNEDNISFEESQLGVDDYIHTVGYENLYTFAPGRSLAWCDRSWNSNPLTAEFIRKGEGRRNFLTSSGDFGLGRKDLEVGDIVCVLFGCSVPVVLRKMNGYYNFLGECYVNGIMEGEAVGALEKGEVESQLFSIR